MHRVQSQINLAMQTPKGKNAKAKKNKDHERAETSISAPVNVFEKPRKQHPGERIISESSEIYDPLRQFVGAPLNNQEIDDP